MITLSKSPLSCNWVLKIIIFYNKLEKFKRTILSCLRFILHNSNKNRTQKSFILVVNSSYVLALMMFLEKVFPLNCIIRWQNFFVLNPVPYIVSSYRNSSIAKRSEGVAACQHLTYLDQVKVCTILNMFLAVLISSPPDFWQVD